MRQARICVVGASNMDLLTKVPRLPKLGETLVGHRFHLGCGGKGANQAVMAARMGARVTMVTKLGRDPFGDITFDNYKKHGINTEFIFWDSETFSGVAPIFVDDEGRNIIVIVPGANFRLTPEEVHKAEAAIAEADVVVCQLEVPLEVTVEALRLARLHGRTTIFNPAPAMDLPDEVIRLSDVLAPNEPETEALTGLSVRSIEEAREAALRLLQRGPGAVIVTLGERGALLARSGSVQHFPAFPVKVVDTTGAGDAFIGALAVRVALGEPLEKAVVFANAAAALSVTKIGTQVSFPSFKEVETMVAGTE